MQGQKWSYQGRINKKGTSRGGIVLMEHAPSGISISSLVKGVFVDENNAQATVIIDGRQTKEGRFIDACHVEVSGRLVRKGSSSASVTPQSSLSLSYDVGNASGRRSYENVAVQEKDGTAVVRVAARKTSPLRMDDRAVSLQGNLLSPTDDRSSCP